MKKEEKNNNGFSFIDLIAVILAIAIPLVPISAQLMIGRGKAREARCIGNMKQIGIANEIWFNNSESYPLPDIPFMAKAKRMASWPDMLALKGIFKPENIEKNSEQLTKIGMPPENFIKVVANSDIFICPSDDPHPHRINEDRARAEGYWSEADKDGYQYSYAISNAAVKKQSENSKGELQKDFHKDASSQVLASDGVWNSAFNFSAAYVADPKCKYDEGGDWCNRVGYFHGRDNRAVIIMRDNSAKTVDYGEKGEKVNPIETFFYGPKEKLTVHH
jgi:hypothetical protein